MQPCRSCWAIVLLIASCTPTGQGPAGAAPTAAASTQAASGAPSVTGFPGDPCAGPTDCVTCTAKPGCRFCTSSPRACMSIDVATSGFCQTLSLGHPSSCGSDPVVQQGLRHQELEARKQAALDTARGMTPSSTIDARLERFSTVDIAVPANVCHTLVWTLSREAKPGDVAISLAFETSRSSTGGLTGFNTETRVGTSGVLCSSEAGRERFRVVDRYSRAPVTAAGTGAISFVLYTRARSATDPDASEFSTRTPPGSAGVNCEECRFPCETDKRACDGDCFRSGLNPNERKICEHTCEQLLRSCLRGCPGCW